MSWQQRLQWSNSGQSWQERGALAMLVVAVAALFWFGSGLSTIVQVSLWGLLLLLAAALLRRGWLKLFGPVLFYELVRIARRSRFVWIRFGYACLLFFFLSTTFSNALFFFSVGGTSPREQAAYIAETYFQTFMYIQMIAVVVLTPAYVAGAIADEKEKRTIEFMFATDLRNREIVLSKLGARLANLTLFLLAGLPILSFVQFLGGVDPNLVLAGFLATAMTMLGLAGVSILFSAICRRARDAIALSYLAVLAYLGMSFMSFLLPMELVTLPLWFGDDPPTVGTLVMAFNAGNLFIGLGQIAGAGTPAAIVPTLLRNYVIFQAVLTTACVVWATLRLRAIALQQQSEPRRRLAGWLAWWRPEVSDASMYWKELFVEGGIRIGWLGYLIIGLVVLMTLFPGYMILYQYGADLLFHANANATGVLSHHAREINVWVRIAGTIVACLLLLSVAVRASTAIVGERERQTFDSLLTTPLESDTMLHAKWLGSVMTVRLGWVWLALIWLPALFIGGVHLVALPMFLAAWFIYAAFCAVLGLWFSMVCRTSLQATVSTVGVIVALTVAHWFIWMICGPLFFFAGGGDLGFFILKLQVGLTPPLALGFLAFVPDDFSSPSNEMAELIGFCIAGLIAWAVGGLVLWFGIASPHFQRITRRLQHSSPEFVDPEPDDELS